MKDLSIVAIKNQLILELYSNYLNENSKRISKAMVEELSSSCGICKSDSLFLLVAAEFGLDLADNEDHKSFAYGYIKPYLSLLSPDEYINNPYYQNIKFKKIKKNHWEITYLTYEPYELFVCNDLTVNSDYQEFPNIGYFDQPFTYLAVLENNREWMTLTPNEIETMKMAINQAKGKVITFGLGLGYFAYMVSLKESVKKITIIEKDATVIELFVNNILPFFKYANKIEIINTDAFVYLQKQMSNDQFDFAFVDLWHDVSDGVELYLKVKKYEERYNNTKFMYWIEESIISYLRWYLYHNFEMIRKNKLINVESFSSKILDKESILKIFKN